MKGMKTNRNSNSKSFLMSYDGGISSGILSPALSASGGSTTVTPITPMTPLTTPRTPLQILLGRQTFGVGGPYGRQQRPMPPRHQDSNLSDDEDDQYREKQALRMFANFINTAETALNDITEREKSGHQVLGPGIVRCCEDLADEIEGVARQIRKEHIQAAQHLEHVQSDQELNLLEEGSNNDGTEEKVSIEVKEAALALSIRNSESTSSFQSHEEYISNLSMTHTLLLDLAAALRAISQQEAQELGEVALEVARMFVWSLHQVHGNMIQLTLANDSLHSDSSLDIDSHHAQRYEEFGKKAILGGNTKPRVTWSNEGSNSHGLGPVVEIFGEEERKDEHSGTPTKKTVSFRYTPQLSPIPSSPEKLSSSMISSKGGERVRVIWQPLLPAITDASIHCVNSAKEHPIPAIAIGLTCGPAAIATAAIAGPPLLVADWAIQQTYDALSEHAIVQNVEKGAANALQVAKLTVLCSKLVIKQGISVGERQIERRGGVGKITSDVVGGAVDMAMHPIDTAGKAWDGLWWMGGALRDAVGFVKESMNDGELRMDMH